MAKTTKITWGTNLSVTWVVLGISLFVNTILMSLFAYLWTWHGDESLINTSLNHACIRDYDKLMATLPSTDQKVVFSEGYCHRNVTTGADLSLKVENGHLIQN